MNLLNHQKKKKHSLSEKADDQMSGDSIAAKKKCVVKPSPKGAEYSI